MKRIKFLPNLFFGLLISVLFLLSSFLFSKPVNAASLINAKDYISTSRPSSYTYLGLDASANVSTQIIVNDNGSRWIASDSAVLTGGTSETVTVASMSAANVPSAGKRTLNLTGKTTNAHGTGTSVYTASPAKHTITFTTNSAIPNNGLIQIYFPVGEGTSTHLPSPVGFSFNNLDQNNIGVSGPMVCASWTLTPTTGLAQCNLSTGSTGPTQMTLTIGASNPTLLNPTKTATAGTADTWAVQIKTTDNSGNVIDNTKIRIGTIDSVDVYATVEPTFTFTIGGIGNGLSVNTGNAVGCGNTEAINTGFSSSATEVNLGVLGTSQINISAQLLTVATNGDSGYSVTATASGHLVDSALGYWIPDAQGTPTGNDLAIPVVLTAGTPAFGIHACGLNATAAWATGKTGLGLGAKYANPSSTYYYTLASTTTGPITGTGGNGLTTVEYAATVSSAVPAGNYHTAMTYVATPVF